MQSFVSIVTGENYPGFIARDPTKYKVLLFTERKTTAPIFKALSKQFKDKLLFGEVRKNSETDLVQKFNVQQFPTLLVVTDPQSFTGEAYSGELKIDRLTKFLNTYSYKTAVYEKKLDFLRLTPQVYRQGVCSKRSSNICLIFFTTTSVAELLHQQVKPLLDTFKNEPLSLVWSDKREDQALHQQFEGGKYHLVAYKPKRGKFVGYKNTDFSSESVRQFVDDILGGGGEYLKFEDEELRFAEERREDL
jgi:Thioredoxin